MSQPEKRFVRELEEAGLVIRRKRGAKSGFVVYSATGQLLGAFGANIEKGRTKANLLAQIKRATGIVVETHRCGAKR